MHTPSDKCAEEIQRRTGPPGTCQVGRFVRRPGGPPLQMLKEGVERRTGSWGSSLGREGSPPINYLQGSRVSRYDPRSWGRSA